MPGLSLPSSRRILFIHGLLHGAWCWSDAWRAYFDDRGFPTEVVNLPGHGGTGEGGGDQRWASLKRYGDALVRMVGRFDPTPVLVGHSLGAMLIQSRLHQLNPPAVILLSPTHPAAFRWAMWQHFKKNPLPFLRAQGHGSPRSAIATLEECREWFFCDSTPPEVVARCFEQLEEDSYRVCLELLLRRDIICRPGASIPVLVLGAGQDQCVPRHITEMVAKLHGVHAQYFDDMGHDLMLEPGWEQVADRILCWLRELGLAPQPSTPIRWLARPRLTHSQPSRHPATTSTASA